jgi:purine-nucleoside phosphorylase
MSASSSIYSKAGASADFIRSVVGGVPTIAVVLGSGLGVVAERLTNQVVLPFAEIPNFPTTTVAGHAGNLVLGATESGAPVTVLQGRYHYYEGHNLDTVTFPVRVLQRLGVKLLILTAAVGGIADSLRAGQIVCVVDHLNLMGDSPLRGPNDFRLGTRFPDMTQVYAPRLLDLAQEHARRIGIVMASCVYACMPGPSYETPAEIRMLRTLGADVVGMSTVPEAIVARHGGLEVLALALVTNAAAGVSGEPITHTQVLEVGRAAATEFSQLLLGIVDHLHADHARPSSDPR